MPATNITQVSSHSVSISPIAGSALHPLFASDVRGSDARASELSAQSAIVLSEVSINGIDRSSIVRFTIFRTSFWQLGRLLRRDGRPQCLPKPPELPWPLPVHAGSLDQQEKRTTYQKHDRQAQRTL